MKPLHSITIAVIINSTLLLASEPKSPEDFIAAFRTVIKEKSTEKLAALTSLVGATDACGRRSESPVIRVITGGSATAGSRNVGEHRRRRARGGGRASRRTKTTFEGRKISSESGSGGKSIRATGGGRSPGSKMRYKIPAQGKRLGARRLWVRGFPMRYKISAAVNPLCWWGLSR